MCDIFVSLTDSFIFVAISAVSWKDKKINADDGGMFVWFYMSFSFRNTFLFFFPPFQQAMLQYSMNDKWRIWIFSYSIENIEQLNSICRSIEKKTLFLNHSLCWIWWQNLASCHISLNKFSIFHISRSSTYCVRASSVLHIHSVSIDLYLGNGLSKCYELWQWLCLHFHFEVLFFEKFKEHIK